MDWEKDTVSRIEKINNQFLELLKSMNEEVDVKSSPYSSKHDTCTSGDLSYHERLIENSRRINEVPKHAFTLDDAEYRMEVDKKLDSIYISKQIAAYKKKVYDIQQICASNEGNMITIPYKEIPKEYSLTVRRNWSDTLFSDVDLNMKIDIWGPVKKFCLIQIKI